MKKKLNLSIIILGISLLSSTAQIYPVRPQLSDKHSFSMILLPDPQSYNKFDANQPLFELQTAWIANSIEPLNIKGVLCTGDLVEQNEIRIPDGINGNQTSEEQWQAASRAFERLDDKISYVVCTGNHDYGYEKAENRLCHLPDYFPSERNSCWKKSLVETGLNYQGIPTLEMQLMSSRQTHGENYWSYHSNLLRVTRRSNGRPKLPVKPNTKIIK